MIDCDRTPCPRCDLLNAALAVGAARLRDADPEGTKRLVERGMAVVRRLMAEHAPPVSEDAP